MKRIKLIGMLAGVTALAIAAGATYAWFVDTAGPMSLAVNTATIAIDSIEREDDLGDKLPGELIGFVDCKFTNDSTRESVVEFTLEALDIAFLDDEEGDYDPEEREIRKGFLLDALNSSFETSGLFEREDGSDRNYYIPQTGNRIYLWLDANEPLNDTGEFSITLTVPEELGGNVGYFSGEGTVDRSEEHGAIVSWKCQAFAVQGTYAALADVFGTDVAGHFFP